MAWKIKFRPGTLKDLSKLDSQIQKRLLDFLDNLPSNPRQKGIALKTGKSDPPLWRYRVGNYRIICRLRDEDYTVLILRIGHRGKIYT
ncbi:MAG: type II toxin-antitoxin system RelE/ParE family toxin [Nitrospinae bacterium]|nr:type II toxin-antitoxin system RelE/ParE family toxin [Nitrospinota bacterium]